MTTERYDAALADALAALAVLAEGMPEEGPKRLSPIADARRLYTKRNIITDSLSYAATVEGYEFWQDVNTRLNRYVEEANNV